ncbi:MAG: hypothetical protein MRY83_06910 [Flavobacteriales bacterium]|nr:hypothetical protein [Flavobacteriales bacterium]
MESAASNFNALTRPPIILIKNSEDYLIKRRETISDIFARDIIPEHIKIQSLDTVY